ncbi:MAG: copper amine oxidase N-terminal domain-containing protein [Anaerovoracaceae bacterium]
MKKKLLTVFLVGALIISLGTVAFAASQIKVVLNGEELGFDVDPTITNGRVMVPVRTIAQALGAEVRWDGDTKTVYIDSEEEMTDSNRIALLESALAPKSSLSAVNSWAEAVKTRNGAWQYAVMTPDLQEKYYEQFASLNWTTGTSSPWIKEYMVIEKGNPDKNTYFYEVEFTWTDSTMQTSTTKEYVTVKNTDGIWLVSSIDMVHVRGNITEITLDDNGNIRGVVVGSVSPDPDIHTGGTLYITEETNIYKGYTNELIKPADLKVGDYVEGTFTDGPMILIYPPQGSAKIIRVF